MNFTKNKGLIVAIATICLVLFNVTAFLLPFAHTINFWLGYCFATVSVLLLLFAVFFASTEGDLKATFLNFPIINIAWIYFVLQISFAFWQMSNPLFPYTLALVGDSVLLGLFLILAIAAFIGKRDVAKIDEKISTKVFYIKNLQADVELLETADQTIATAINDLAESIHFSDPMSHSGLAAIENKLENKVEMLKVEINNPEAAISLCDEIQSLLKERNSKAKLLKGTPEPKTTVDNSGVKVVGVTFSIVSVLAAVILVICFIIIPSNKYNTALNLFNDGNHDQAVIAFENLGNFRDSVEKIEAIKYEKAEKAFNNEQYIDAMQVYAELGDYKDSKKRIEQIYNMGATGEDIYFGSYKGVPIAWIALESTDSKMLLISKEPVIQLAMNNEIEKVDWDGSSIKEWLNKDFLNDFSEDQQAKIIKNTDSVFLLSEDEFENYSETTNMKTTSEWWLSTTTGIGFMFVDGNGKVNTDGESAVRAKGIRPVVWINLK